MKVVSKFSDYYDSVAALGHDVNSIYVRDTKELIASSDQRAPSDQRERYKTYKPFLANLTLPLDARRKNRTVTMNAFTVLFCGRLYGGIKIYSHLEQFKVAATHEVTCCYTLDAFNEQLKLLNFDLDLDRVRWTRWHKQSDDRTIREHLSLNGDQRFFKLAVDHKLKCLVVEEHSKSRDKFYAFIDPCLRNYQFYKVFDPYAAFQELDMFISGILAPENRPTVKIDDKFKIQQQGFDKWSFRKLPERL